MSYPLSVIMPVYNQEKYVSDTINSVLSQNFTGFEFLILDDGSTDGSAAIIKEYAAKDHRIQAYFYQNTGRCSATNTLINLAGGKFCALLDADDLMMPGRLMKQYQFHLNNPEVDASSAHCAYINSRGITMGIQDYPFLKSIGEAKEAIKTKEIIHCAITALMIKRDVYIKAGGLRTQFWPCDDLDFVNRLVENNNIVVIIQDVLMKYRVHSSSASSSKQSHMFQKIDYTRYCIGLRRTGQPEISFQQYISQVHKPDSWQKKWRKQRHQFAILYHKKAGFSRYRKRYIPFLFYIFVAGLLDTGYFIESFKKRKKSFRNQNKAVSF